MNPKTSQQPVLVQEEITIEHIQDEDDLEEETGEIAVDIYKTEHDITIIAPIAGVSKENLSIKMNENVLIMSGKRRSPLVETRGNYVVNECFWGKFSRMIVLPSKIDVSRMKASFKQGILVIKVPVIFEPKEKIVDIEE